MPLGEVFWLLLSVVVVVEEGGGPPEVDEEEEGCDTDEESRDASDAAPEPLDEDAATEEVLFLSELGTAWVTILTPSPSLLEAGMKSVVWPSLRLRDVRSGW